jgi:hypothetical protein
MAPNFIACDREQELLLPPSLREWLPEGHLAWCVIDAVGQLPMSIEICRSVITESCRSTAAWKDWLRA